MLRVLAVSSLFPSRAAPYLGSFIQRQMIGLAARPEVRLAIVAPAIGTGVPPEQEGRPAADGLNVLRPAVGPGPSPEALPAAMAEAILPLAETLRDEAGLDVLTAELLWPDGPAVAEVARKFGLPFSVKARGHEFEFLDRRPALLKQALEAGRAASAMLAVSGALRDRMAAAGFERDRIAVHPTGVDRKLFRPRDRAAAKARLGVAGPLLLSVGSLIPRKGHDRVVEALARLPGATLFIAGGGAEAPRLEARIEALGVAGRARLLGYVPHMMLPALLAAADVTILASSYEGLANVWVESLASGTPVVTTDVDGARETIDRPAAGRIVARDPAAIADAVRELLADPPAPESVRAASERFSWEANAEALEKHLRALCGAA